MTPRPASTSQQQIVDAALALLDEQGHETFSMRKLGSRLAVDPMTIYHHVPDKGALFDLVVDRIWTGLQPPTTGDWTTQVAGLARELRRSLMQHPRLVVLVATRPAVTPSLLSLVDQTVTRLVAAGLGAAEAMRLLDCVVAFTVGKVQGELRQPTGGSQTTPEESLQSLLASLPGLASAIDEGYQWQPDEEFELGLTALLAGWPVSSGSTAGS
ncbi:TetR/AcrR family transcriptional regulator [Luteococcus sp. H138]|uniref:TetR/AcrR family transcriptional regulator n=1 Tax=unclassified Luteococcus TaxID=2639923 RepID=UPI00313E1F54